MLPRGLAAMLDAVKTKQFFQSQFQNLLGVEFNRQHVIDHLKDKRKSIFQRQRQHPLNTSASTSGADATPSLYAFLQSLDMPRPDADSDGGRLPDENANSAHFARQMTRNYLGDAQLRFLTFVRRHDTQAGNDLYFRGLSIVQSSGTGKTRLVLEMANYTPLLFICLRDVEARADHGFPLGDKSVSAYFSQAQTDKSGMTFDLQVAAFVGAWFKELAKKLDEMVNPDEQYAYLKSLQRYVDAEHTSGRNRESDSVALQNLMAERKKFFEKVIQEAEKLRKNAPEDTSNTHDDTFKFCMLDSFSSLRRHLCKVRDYVWDLDENKEAREMTGGEAVRKPPVFVAFDECAQLCQTKSQGGREGDHQLNSLRRAWYYLLRRENEEFKDDDNPHVWLILLSTNSAATILIDTPDSIPSLRRRGLQAAPTFVGLGFDVMLHEQPPLMRARDVTKIEALRAYGRPLWTSLLLDQFWKDAQAKLLGASQKKYEDFVARQKQNMVFNVLASRLCLRFVPNKNDKGHNEARELARDSINRHMRILERVQAGSLVVSSPSEPVLAIAALRTMVPKHDTLPKIGEIKVRERYQDILSNFNDNSLIVLEGDALKGVTGELMARLVFLAGWDAAKLTMLLAESPGSKRKHQSSDTFSLMEHPHKAPMVGASSTTDSREPSSAAANVRHQMSPKDTETLAESRTATIDEDRYMKTLVEPLELFTWLENLAKLTEQCQGLLRRRIDELRLRVSVELGQASLQRDSNLANTTASGAAGQDQLPASSSFPREPTLCLPEVKAYVNFTHFDVLPTTISSISCDYLWWCWKRGVALQATHDQAGIDGIIPVFVGDLDRQFASLQQGQMTKDEPDTDSTAAKHMTYVAWEAKNALSNYSTVAELCKDQPFRGPPLLPAGRVDEPSASIDKDKKGGAEATTGKATHSKKRAAVQDDQENDGDKEVVRGKSSPRGAEAGPEKALSPEPLPLTTRGLLTILVEFGTRQKIAIEKRGNRFKGLVAAKVYAAADRKPEEEDWMYLDIRGLSSEAYPCLDTLDIRKVAQKILSRFPVNNSDQPENCILSPILNNSTRPHKRGHISTRNTL